MHHQVLLAALLTAITTTMHAACTAGLLRFLSVTRLERWAVRSLATSVVTISALVLTLLAVSLVEASLWSLTYLIIGAIQDPQEALYFSIVTFTTLGYGDVVPGPGWRLLAGLQAACGIIVFGWTTALIFAVVQHMAEKVRSDRT